MRLALALLLLCAPAFAQAWADLSSTHLQTVAPSNCMNSSPPSYCAGVTFAYSDNFHGVVDAWSSGVARTKVGSEQLCVFGGGHVITFDNAIYCLNLYVNPATVSALTVPSIPTGSGSPVTAANITCTDNADGTPLSMHSYGQMVYLPVADKMFFWADGAGNYCASAGTREVWLFSFANNTWSLASPTGFDVHAGSDAAYAFCVLDPTTAHETVICQWGNNSMLLRYDATANTWAKLTNFGDNTYPQDITLGVDPVRRILIMIGRNGGSQAVYKVDISNSSYTGTDITGSLSGCSGISVDFPGVQHDPTLANFMVYPGTGDSVYEFNPDTGVCTAHTGTGGPTATNGTGTFGRFAYFSSLRKYATIVTTASDAFTFQMPLNEGPGSVIGGKVSFGGRVIHQ